MVVVVVVGLRLGRVISFLFYLWRFCGRTSAADFSVVVCPLSVLQDAERRTRLLGLLVEVMYGLLWLMAHRSCA